MTYETPPLGSSGAVWSGRCLADRCLVRAFSLGARPATVTLQPFPGLRVELPVGTTRVVHRDGAVHP